MIRAGLLVVNIQKARAVPLYTVRCFFCLPRRPGLCYTVVDMSNASVLKSCSLFRGFSDAGLAMMEKIARERSIPAGSPIFVESMVGESLFVIKAGVVELSLKAVSGKDVKLDRLAPGETFGELGLLIGGHRMVTATAGTACELIEINRRDFAKLQKQKPQACLKLMLAIVDQVGKRLTASREHLRPLLLAQLDH